MTPDCLVQKVIEQCVMLQAVIEGYLRPMLADNWDRGSLYSYRAFSFPSDMPYEEIRQPVMFITGEKDGALTRGAKKVCTQQQIPCVRCTSQSCFGSHSYYSIQYFACCLAFGTLLNLFRPWDSLLCKVCICPCSCLLVSSNLSRVILTDKLPYRQDSASLLSAFSQSPPMRWSCKSRNWTTSKGPRRMWVAYRLTDCLAFYSCTSSPEILLVSGCC